jgi:hypothetical protein
MLFAIILAAIVLLQVVSNYTFIHILLGTATVWVLARLVRGPRASEELPKSPCVPLADSGR